MRWWWEDVPRSVSRVAPMGHMVLTDGSYVRAFAGGSAAPVAALALGVLLGWRPWTDTYATFSYSVGLTAGLVVLGVLGASLGLAAWVGWCIGDWFLATIPPGNYSALGRVVVDLLLGVAVVVLPIVAQGLRARTEQLVTPVVGQAAGWIAWGAFAVTAGVGAYVWELSVPQLIRPLWVFNNLSPELPAVEPFQRDVGITSSVQGVDFLDGLTSSSLFWFVLLAGGVRAGLTMVAARRDSSAAQPAPPAAAKPQPSMSPAARRHLQRSTAAGQRLQLASVTAVLDEGAAAPPGPWVGAGLAALKALASAAAVAVVLAGLTTTTLPEFASRQWLGMLTAFAIAALVRVVGLGFLPGYVRLVNRVPVVARIVVCMVVAQTIAKDLIDDALRANDADFSSLLVPMLVSVGVATLLIPGRRPSELADAGAPA
jgi:hypothetical protein